VPEEPDPASGTAAPAVAFSNPSASARPGHLQLALHGVSARSRPKNRGHRPPAFSFDQRPSYWVARIAATSATGSRRTGPVAVTSARTMVPLKANGAS